MIAFWFTDETVASEDPCQTDIDGHSPQREGEAAFKEASSV